MTDEGGTVAILLALLLLTMMGMAALAIDFGALLVEQRSLQNGADAAALAVARNCAGRFVDGAAYPPCSNGPAQATAQAYFDDNAARTVTVDRDLNRGPGGKTGDIAVLGEITLAPIFARAVGFAGPFVPSATATARWGPLIAYDAVFPLTVCDGALPAPNTGPVTRQVEPPPAVPPPLCSGAPAAPAFGWLTPDTVPACTAGVNLLPPGVVNVSAADSEPALAGCAAAIDQLHDDIDTGTPDERTRVLAVHDASAGVPGSHPAHALVAFEFTGAKFGGRTSHVSTSSWSAACDLADPAVRCIEGFVRYDIPPLDGPVADAVQAALPGLADTSVLDVRLVE